MNCVHSCSSLALHQISFGSGRCDGEEVGSSLISSRLSSLGQDRRGDSQHFSEIPSLLPLCPGLSTSQPERAAASWARLLGLTDMADTLPLPSHPVRKTHPAVCLNHNNWTAISWWRSFVTKITCDLQYVHWTIYTILMMYAVMYFAVGLIQNISFSI